MRMLHTVTLEREEWQRVLDGEPLDLYVGAEIVKVQVRQEGQNGARPAPSPEAETARKSRTARKRRPKMFGRPGRHKTLSRGRDETKSDLGKHPCPDCTMSFTYPKSLESHFDARKFGLVELDESSMLSAVEGVRRNMLIKKFSEVPYRFCFTATPARNDIQDIVSHAEFLGVMKRRDVLATFFLHDASDARATGWRLKNHAREAFWRWMASWGMSLRKPSDLGYSDDGFVLPPMQIAPVIVEGEYTVPGRLFADRLRGIVERSAVRRQTQAARVRAACEIVAVEKSPAIAWVGLNEEGRDIAAELGSRAILIEGAMSPEEKEERLDSFIASDSAVLVTKTRIAGYGMNFQHCWRMAFVGLGDSYEQYYQAIRRCWRFGQKRTVKAYVVLSEIEKVIYKNVLRKEREAEEATAELVRHVAAYERAEIGRIDLSLKYDAAVDMRLPAWMGATA